MTVPGNLSSPLLATATGAAAAEYVIPKSLRFSEDDAANLKKTPSTAGNRVTWSWSAWVKRTKSSVGSTYQTIFSAGADGNNNSAIVFDNSDRLEIWNVVGNANVTQKITSRVFRDFSSWYHFVVSATSSTLTLYVNGVEVTDWDTDNEPGGENWSFTGANAHYLGHYWDGGSNFKGDFLLADVQFVDGQAKAASDFGETRSSDGVWVPKKYTGTYGTNGFHLNFSDSSTIEALGFDSAPTTPDPDPKKGMDVITYTGTGAVQNVGGLSFEPGLVWIKDRTSANSHNIHDSVRGTNLALFANANNAETAGSSNPYVSAFNPDGFTLGANNDVNTNNNNYVAWVWRAGGPAVSNTDGTTTSQVSANTDYGFSIVSFTGTGSTATIGHGLGATPKWIMVKKRNSTANWVCYHDSLGINNHIKLSTNAAANTAANIYTSAPTSSVFTLGSETDVNGSSDTFIAYCWSETSGYSKMSSYTGNGSSTGPVVTTGFKVRWLLIKRTDSGTTDNWALLDSERDSTNPISKRLFPNLDNAESDASGNDVDFLDDGFQPKNTNDHTNANNGNYIYIAFGDRPGNNWDVNNIVTNEGLTTSKTQFDVVTWTGNGGNLKVGGPVYSAGATATGGFESSNPAANGFNGTLTAGDRANGVTVGGTIEIVFNPGLSVSSTVGIWSGKSGFKYQINDSGSYTSVTDATEQWHDASFSGTLTNLKIQHTASNEAPGFSGIRVDGTTLIDGTGPGLKFQPDFVWIKDRSNNYSHRLADSVRGSTRVLFSDQTNAEQVNEYGTIDSFNSDGFTLRQGSNNSGVGSNTNNANMVAWCWKAGGTAVSNTDGSITSQVSANTNYGFSIVTYTGGTSDATIGHGLGQKPTLYIVKARESSGYTDSWNVYHTSLGESAYLKLQTTDAASTGSTIWNSTAPTSTVFSVDANSNANENNVDYVAYCFADVPGYQRISSFIGNGSNSGPTVVCGFKPRFVLLKNKNDSDDWKIYDSERDPVFISGVNQGVLSPNSSSSELQNKGVEFTASGFTVKDSNNSINGSGDTIIYWAIGDDEIGSDEDCLVDVPNAVTADADATDTTGGYQRGNYATLNPLATGGAASDPANGNLDFSSGSSYGSSLSTIAVSSGKWYWEFTKTDSSNGLCVGVAETTVDYSTDFPRSSVGYAYVDQGKKANNNSYSNFGATWTNGDTIGIAFDADAGTLEFYKNGVSQGEAYTGLTSGPYVMAVGDTSGSNSVSGSANFGQMRFKYPIPTGFSSLNTTALPAATIEDASVYFDTKLWTGNGSTQSIDSLAFSPDLAWIKGRNHQDPFALFDTVRGVQKRISSNLNNAEVTSSDGITSFNSDGWTMGANGSNNANNLPYVGWVWDAGSSTVSNTDGSITSSVRANPTAGFSIVSYTGSGSNATVGHGLNAALDFIIVKRRSAAGEWRCWHNALSNTQGIDLNSNGAAFTDDSFNDTIPTSSVFSLKGGVGNVNASSATYIAYCISSVAGFSAVGSYEGTGSAGNFVHTGFRVAWLLLKNADGTNNWQIMDTTREPINQNNVWLQPNTSTAEQDNSAIGIDFLSNGFCLRGTDGGVNGSGNTYVYYAVAENPFSANGGLAR